MRLNTPRGSDHPRALFSPEQTKEILKSYAENPRSERKIAAEWGCSKSAVHRILKRESYR